MVLVGFARALTKRVKKFYTRIYFGEARFLNSVGIEIYSCILSVVINLRGRVSIVTAEDEV